MRIPVEPAILPVYIKGLQNATVDFTIYVPWKNCKLVYAYTQTCVAEGNHGAGAVHLELDAASGTEIGQITIAQNAAVGDIDEMVFTSTAAGKNLSADNSSRDAINLEVALAASSAWEGMLYMYFEPWAGE